MDVTRQTEKDRKLAEKLQQLDLIQPKTDESRECSKIKNVTKASILDRFKTHFVAPSTINVRIVSSHPRLKARREKNFSGPYSFVEKINKRPVYKVRFLFSIHSCDNGILSFLSSARPKN